MKTQIIDFANGIQKTSQLELAVQNAENQLKAINEANPGRASLTLIEHIQIAKDERDISLKAYNDHLNKMHNLNEEIFEWLEDVPNINAVDLSYMGLPHHELRFEREGKKISLVPNMS